MLESRAIRPQSAQKKDKCARVKETTSTKTGQN
jgi:hypothetical protein